MTTIDESLRSLPPGLVKLIKIDVQGYELHVIQGMAETLRSNPDAILIVEIFPEGLAEAGSSASQLVGRLRDLGFDGWEFNDFRLIPMQEPWTYDLIRGGKYVDVAMDKAHVDGNLVTAPAWPAHPQWLAKFLQVLGTRIEP